MEKRILTSKMPNKALLPDKFSSERSAKLESLT